MSGWLTIPVLCLLLALPFIAPAQDRDPEATRLGQRLQAIDLDPERNAFAAYERLQARQAVQALIVAKRKQRPQALQIARIRVETAEIAVGTEAARAELQRLETERAELLVEASRRDAERARAEAERLRVEAQIHAEEVDRLREAVEAESRSRQEAESLLDTVAAGEAEKLRLAREREAALGGQPAEAGSTGGDAGQKPKPKPKPRPKPPARP
jgi:hypothetical protein